MLKYIVVGVCLAVSLSSCASTGGTTATAKPTVVTRAAATQAPCSSPDGSTRVAAGVNTCSAPGSAFTRSDIDRTGQADVGDALRNLSPSLTVH